MTDDLAEILKSINETQEKADDPSEFLLSIIEGAPSWNLRPLDRIEAGVFRSLICYHDPRDAATGIIDLLGTSTYRPSIAQLREAIHRHRGVRLRAEARDRKALKAAEEAPGIPMPPEIRARMEELRKNPSPVSEALEVLSRDDAGDVPTPGEEAFGPDGLPKRREAAAK